MSETEFTNIIYGLFNEKVAAQPLWMDRDFWRYDQIDPWHDDALRIQEEARRGVVTVLRVGHREPNQPDSAMRILALRRERRDARRDERDRERQRSRPLAQLVQAERRARRSPGRVVRPSAWATPQPGRVKMWKAYGEVLARDDVALIHAPEACKVADAGIYKGEPYTDASGKRWRFDGHEWVAAGA